MPIKETRGPVRSAKLARQIRRLERRIRTQARRERRQMRRLDRIRACRSTLDGRLAALRAALEPSTPGQGTANGSEPQVGAP